MSLAPGSQLGPYEILAPIGAGGMGEVYRARDPRLDRVVAIKVLRDGGAADTAQLQRFEQEARSVALLDHPNILQVHDTGVHEGRPYIVMEFLEGTNLRERMDGRPLPLRRVLDLAIQIARALAVAHAKQIVHRDLKPENIFVDPAWRVKVLDFGLAKLRAAASADPDQTLDHRQDQAALTVAGSLVGTTGYMSPEQVNGWAVDARSDLFSFGIILYEMITGTPPFKRPSMVETLHAILKEEPPEPPRLPPALERVLFRCLEKDPRARFQSAADLIFNLEGASLPMSSVSMAGPGLRLRRMAPRLAKGLLVGAGAALLGLAGFLAGRGAAGSPPMAYHHLTYRQGVVREARFAPDGQTYVFSLSEAGEPAQLMVGRTEGVGARSLGLPPGTSIQGISGSGEMAILMPKEGSAAGTLALAPLSGGAPREVLDNVLAADWAPNGRDLVVLRESERHTYVLEYPIGHRIYEGPPVSPAIVDCPRMSPRGDQVAILEHFGIGREYIALIGLDGRRKVLVEGGCDSLGWAPDGRRLYYTFRHEDDRRELRAVTLGGRQRVLDTVLGRMHVQDVSRSGRLLVDMAMERSSLVYQGPTGERDLSWLQTSNLADLSADGAWVLMAETLEGSGPGGVYLRRTGGGDALRLGDGDPLSLSQDGKHALVLSLDARKALYVYPAGAGTPRLLNGDIRADWAVFVAGDRQVLLGGTGPDGQFRVWLQPSQGGPARIWPGRFTPEAFCIPGPGGDQVAIGPIEGRLAISTWDGRPVMDVPGLRPGEQPLQWEAGGKAIYVGDLASLPVRVTRIDLATGRRTLWRTVQPSDRSGVTQVRNLVVSMDGRAVAFSCKKTLTSDVYVIDPIR